MLKLHDFCNRAGERIAARHTVRRRPATRSLPGRTKDRQFRRPCDLQQILYAESHRLLPHPDEFRCANLRQSEAVEARSEDHTSELQSLMRISYAVFCLKKKLTKHIYTKIS